MSDPDAQAGFFRALKAFQVAEEQARKQSPDTMDAETFQMVIIDLDSAIPALTEVFLGRALVLKAHCPEHGRCPSARYGAVASLYCKSYSAKEFMQNCPGYVMGIFLPHLDSCATSNPCRNMPLLD